MRLLTFSVSAVAFSVALASGACHPSDRCGEGLVWTGAACIACPPKSTWRAGSCVCDQPEYYSYVNWECSLNDGAMPPMDAASDDDSGAAQSTCPDYCGFATACIGSNDLAASVVPDVVIALHGDDAAACGAACQTTLGSDGAGDPALACIADGRARSMCDELAGFDGLTASLELIGDCCTDRRSNVLCRSICAALKVNDLAGNMAPFCD